MLLVQQLFVMCILISGIVALVRQHRYGDTFHSVATFLCGAGFGISLVIVFFAFMFFLIYICEDTVFGGFLGVILGPVAVGWVSIPLLIFTCYTVKAIGENDETFSKKMVRLIICLIIQIIVAPIIIPVMLSIIP